VLPDVGSEAPFRSLPPLVVRHSNAIPIDRRESSPYDVVRMILRLDVPEGLCELSHRHLVDLTVRQGYWTALSDVLSLCSPSNLRSIMTSYRMLANCLALSVFMLLSAGESIEAEASCSHLAPCRIKPNTERQARETLTCSGSAGVLAIGTERLYSSER
jgi:hypothetical protein